MYKTHVNFYKNQFNNFSNNKIVQTLKENQLSIVTRVRRKYMK